MRDQQISATNGLIARASIRASDLPLAGASRATGLAIVTGIDGPSYRPLGATMVLAADGELRGSISSGCIDADIARHVAEVVQSGQARQLRYGMGSPFRDLELPCGGGLDIRVLLAPAEGELTRIVADLEARKTLHLWLGEALRDEPVPGASMQMVVDPDPRFAVFGKGPEAVAFARMTAAAGYETVLVSPDDETLAAAEGNRLCPVRLLPAGAFDVRMDAHTAAVLFFHDHDLEPEILSRLLPGPAFYVGAQGSHRTAERRLQRLRERGVDETALARLRGPIGVIPSTRDPRTLAASVLAEILAEACRR
ncbi:XdhC family protein [Paracoccus sp. MBLB3053]|uniref:XdhC family protein n=1 Tax=Paracoccus aurantius TaxID=3073814 RepID=A0ABU2HLZ6_9RHOB|nr:XdhC family protein [Paracoccus sp. MBLB3053]MDS9466058.1 XdhC family protein [Paracoccus sp. MBLB3053]